MLGCELYSFKRFEAVLGWTESVIRAFLYIKDVRSIHIRNHSLDKQERQWRMIQRCHGLSQAVQTAIRKRELKHLRDSEKSLAGWRKSKSYCLTHFRRNTNSRMKYARVAQHQN